jgi:uncharacterized protein (DUF4415 family)
METKLILSTAEEDARIAAAAGDDHDDAPDLVDALADGRVVYVGRGLKAHDRITVRVDPEVVRRFQDQGPDWEERMNETLRRAVGL